MASALARPLVTTIRAVSPDAPLDEALDDAVAAGILHVRGDHVGFVHPLYAAAIYADLSRGRRHRLHASIAAVVKDLQERGRHLALAAGSPDAVVADEVEAAAGLARDRGAHDAAAELLDHAIRLTPPGDDEPRIRRLWRPRTSGLGSGAAAAAPRGGGGALIPARPSRGAVEGRRADRGHRRRRHGRGTSHRRPRRARARGRHPVPDPRGAVPRPARPRQARGRAPTRRRGPRAAEDAATVEVAAIGYGAAIEDALFSGRGRSRARRAEILAWEPIAAAVDRWPRVRLGEQLMLEGDLAGARDVLEGCLAGAGDEPVPGLLLSLAMLERLEGRFRDALGHAADAAHAVAAWRAPAAELGTLAWLEAQVGLFDDAATHADEALAGARDDVPASTVRGHEARAAIELARGRRRDACDDAVRAVEATQVMGAASRPTS